MTVNSATVSIQTGTFVSAQPVIGALSASCVLSYFAWFAAGQESYESSVIYSGVFDLLTIFTGFLATFYVFVVSRGIRFLEKIKNTNTSKMVVKLLELTIVWSVAMIFVSYALAVVNPASYGLFSLTHAIVFFWIANVSLIAINFARCVGHFTTILSAGS